MAIGTPTERAAASASAQGATTVFSPASTIAAGSVAILGATANANKSISSVADSAGNTWHVDSTGGDGTRTSNFASAQIATQITTGGTITITWSTATSGAIDYWVQEVTGLATSSVIDKFAGASGSTGTLNTGSSGTLTQAAEIAFVIGRVDVNTGWTKGANPWTNVTTPTLTASRSIMEYQIVAATTALTGTGTWSGGVSAQVSRIATYKGATSTTTNQSLTASLPAATATISRSVGKVVSVTLPAATGTVTKQVGKSLVVTLPAAVASIVKRAGKTLVGTVTSLGTVSAVKAAVLALTATVTSTATIRRAVGKTITATGTVAGTISRSVGKAVSAAVSSTAAVTRSVGKAVTATATSTATITRSVAKVVTATVTSTGSLLTGAGHFVAMTATSIASGTLVKRVGKTLSATSPISAILSAIRPAVDHAVDLIANVTSSASIAKQITATLTATITAMGSLVRAVTNPTTRAGTIAGTRRGAIAEADTGSIAEANSGTVE